MEGRVTRVVFVSDKQQLDDDVSPHHHYHRRRRRRHHHLNVRGLPYHYQVPVLMRSETDRRK